MLNLNYEMELIINNNIVYCLDSCESTNDIYKLMWDIVSDELDIDDEDEEKGQVFGKIIEEKLKLFDI